MTNFIRSLKIIPRWIILLIDLAVILLSVWIAYSLRFNFVLSDVIAQQPEVTLGLYLMASLISILLTQSYAGIIRYTSLQDGLRLLITVTLTSVLIFCGSVIYRYVTDVSLVPVSVILITYFCSITLLFLYRMLVKYVFSYYAEVMKVRQKALIFGAGQGGLLTKQVIDEEAASKIRVVGFLEDDPRKIGKFMKGVRIYDAEKDIVRLIKRNHIKELIITVKNITLERKNELVDICLKHSVKVRSVPPADKWVNGELSLKQIKEVNIEDLLGRESIVLDSQNVKREILGKCVLISGAAGSIGSEIVRQVLQFQPREVILVDQSESALYEIEREISPYFTMVQVHIILADIRNSERMRQIFSTYRPNIVYHAAAYKHVPMMEQNVTEAIRSNVLGTKVLSDLSVRYEVEKFVMISTDKAVNPTSVMGASKRISEIYVQSLNDKLKKTGDKHTLFITTRFGNVLGSNGSVIPLFKKQIAAGGPLTVTHPDVTRYFMTIPEACQLVLEAGAMGNGGEIFIFDMGKSIKIADLARKMIRLSGLVENRDIEIVFTGLREGEKLYEELLNDSENNLPTHHNKIMCAQVREIAYHDVLPLIRELIDLAKGTDDMAIVAQMKQIVPEYKSHASRFEELDSEQQATADLALR
ncbi:polysaccharide biosynthesis protein [Roseivirga sp. BDSF3-8]|uniref:polysaccharide biosynthesis protein n=1 Tax=Roseivirga sp. BDSF3-8 TaxID=3241598 RepID=UPI003531FA33